MPEATGVVPAEGTLDAPDGTRVFFRAWARPDARGRVLCVHGLGEHSGRYGRLAAAIREIDLDLFALDLRGHGRSGGRRGHIAEFDRLLDDLDRLRARACGGTPDDPTFALGHSLGGLVVGRWAQESAAGTLAGAVFVAPFVDVALPVPGWKRTLGAAADRILPALSMDNGLPLADLFRREADRRAYDGDSLVHRRITARLWGGMVRASERLVREARRIETPVLFQLAGEDRVVSNEAARRLAAALGSRAEVTEYEGAYHALYHDPRAEEAFADLRAWLGARMDETGSTRRSMTTHTGRQA